MPTFEPTTENGRTIAAMYEAFSRGDVPFVLSCIAEKVEWIETEAANVPGAGRYSSVEEVLQGVFAVVPQHFSQFDLRPERWVEVGDDVVVTGRLVARTLAGRELDAPYAHVFSFEDGKVVRNDNHHDTALWVTALAGAEAPV